MLATNGEEIFFKIKRTTKLAKLQGAYAGKVGKDVNTIRSVVSLFIPRSSFLSTDTRTSNRGGVVRPCLSGSCMTETE